MNSAADNFDINKGEIICIFAMKVGAQDVYKTSFTLTGEV